MIVGYETLEEQPVLLVCPVDLLGKVVLVLVYLLHLLTVEQLVPLLEDCVYLLGCI